MTRCSRRARTAGGMLLACGLLSHGAMAEGAAQWSKNGQRMIIISETEIAVFNAAGLETGRVKAESVPSTVQLSPDGKKALYVTRQHEAWVVDLDKGERVRLFSRAHPLQRCRGLQWTPDSSTVVMTVEDMELRRNPTRVAVSKVTVERVGADGSGKKVLMTYSPAE